MDFDTVAGAMDGAPHARWASERSAGAAGAVPPPRFLPAFGAPGADRPCPGPLRLHPTPGRPPGTRAGLCGMFERKLKELNPNLPKITYDINDLYNYIDTHTDLCALVLEPGTGAYSPYNKDWVKKRVFNHLKKQAS